MSAAQELRELLLGKGFRNRAALDQAVNWFLNNAEAIADLIEEAEYLVAAEQAWLDSGVLRAEIKKPAGATAALRAVLDRLKGDR